MRPPACDDPALRRDGPLTRSLSERFASARPTVPLAAIVIVGYAAMVTTLVGTGYAIVHAGPLAGLRSWDDDVTMWMADHRIAVFDTITAVLSRGGDTVSVVAFAVVVEIVLVVQRRWWVLLIVPIGLGLELATFLTVNAIVGRPRPTVPPLGSQPTTSSFPSGHTAATVVLWGAVALVFWSVSSRQRVRSVAYVVVGVLACAVGTARVYRGMHHPSDVIAGGLMGLTVLGVTVLAVRVAAADAGASRIEPAGADEAPEPPRLPAVSA